MRHRLLAATLAVMATVIVSMPRPASGQLKAHQAWTLGHTPDGQPDFEGVWTNPTITPFERPADLAEKATLTPEEVAQLEQRAAKNRVDRPPAAGDVGSYNQFWFDSGTKVVSTRGRA